MLIKMKRAYLIFYRFSIVNYFLSAILKYRKIKVCTFEHEHTKKRNNGKDIFWYNPTFDCFVMY